MVSVKLHVNVEREEDQNFCEFACEHCPRDRYTVELARSSFELKPTDC
jgi:hypothetical protein